jgi:hypothetical protein
MQYVRQIHLSTGIIDIEFVVYSTHCDDEYVKGQYSVDSSFGAKPQKQNLYGFAIEPPPFGVFGFGYVKQRQVVKVIG